jgi:glycosyltransferase A (GT-A) superfamily protein (DUF2064 family)
VILRPAVAILLEPARLGVKPRLTEDAGAHHAMRLYRVLAARTLAAVRALDLPAVIWFTPVEAQPEMRHWLGPEWELRPQPSGALGARIAAAAHGIEPGAPWIIILSESLGLAPELLASAVDALVDFPAVLGPSQEDGCYLIGARRPLGGLAAEVVGDAAPLPFLRRALDRLAPEWRELPELRTIETGDDARAAGLLS